MRRINYVLSNFSPQLQDYLYQKEIEIVSARDLFQNEYPNDPIKWKIECFRQQIALHLGKLEDPSNAMITSIGDGLFERIACKTICDEFKVNSCSLKLFELPNPQVLCNQIDLIIQCFDELLEIPKDNLLGGQNISFNCNDLYFDYNSDGYLCIFHWEKKDIEKLPPAEIIDLSCSECLHNGQLQDLIVKHQIDSAAIVDKTPRSSSGSGSGNNLNNDNSNNNNNNNNKVECLTPPRSATSTNAPMTASSDSNISMRSADFSRTFTPIASESSATQHLSTSSSASSITFSNIVGSGSNGSSNSNSANGGRKPSLYSLEDNGSTSGESNAEEDEMSVLQSDADVVQSNSSFAVEMSFRSDGIQSRNSDTSELSDMSCICPKEFPSSSDLSLVDAQQEVKHRRLYSTEVSFLLTAEPVAAVGLEEEVEMLELK